jgi:SAM-dependent methyltransferase
LTPGREAVARAIAARHATRGVLPDLGLGAAVQARCAEAFSAATLRLHLACELYAARVAFDLAGDLGWHPLLRAGATLEECLAGLHPQSRVPGQWMLDFLVHSDWLDLREGRYRLIHEPPFTAQDIRAEAEADSPGQSVNFDLLDAVRRQIPPFFREGRPGEQLLFDLGTLPLWLAYFSNRNREYLPNNLFALFALADGLPEGARVLEIGAGAGSFAELLSGEPWRGRIAEYRFTDVSPTFLRKAGREMAARAPGLPFAFQPFDVNRPFEAQGLPAGGFDAIVGVNVLHVARNLPEALARLRTLLAPGGRLVLGECLKPDLATPIYLEFFFKFIRSFTEVELDPVLRPAPGFLTPEVWEALLAHAGFAEVRRYPDTRVMMRSLASFYVGALAART